MQDEIAFPFDKNWNRNRAQRTIAFEGFEFIQLKYPTQLLTLKSELQLVEISTSRGHFSCKALDGVPAAAKDSCGLAHRHF